MSKIKFRLAPLENFLYSKYICNINLIITALKLKAEVPIQWEVSYLYLIVYCKCIIIY